MASLIVVFVAALSVRWIYLRQVEDVPFFHHLVGDAARYWEWAGQIVGGDVPGQEAFYQAPLYPYFLAALRWTVGEDLFTIRLIQALLASLSCVILAAAARGFLNSTLAGIAAGSLLALSPQAIFYGALIQKSVLDLFLSSVLLWVIARAQRTASPLLWFLFTGLTLGLLTLSRENALVLLLPLAGWIWFFFRTFTVRRRLASGGALLLGSALVLLPVGLRNWHVGGVFSLTTVQSGPNFYIGNHEGATGRYVALVPGHESPPFERDDARRLAEQALGHELNDREVSHFWLERSFDYIRKHPIDWLRLVWTKWALVWNRYEIPDTEAWIIYAESSIVLRWLGFMLHFGVLTPLAIAGVILAWPARRSLACVYAITVTLALATAAFYVLGRYRFPLLPLLIIPTAAGLDRVVRMRPSISRGLFAALSALAAAVFCNWPINPESQLNSMAHSNVGTVLAQQGSLEQAAVMFQRAALGNPGTAEPHYNLGLALAMLRRHEQAVEAFTRARSISPNLVNIDYNLAVSLERIGRTADAVAAYQRAVQADPNDTEARAALARLSGASSP